MRRENEILRSDKAKLQSQIHELTNQNAQLIEDHTRDVLSIKAKETQLIRARTDHDAAEQTVQHQQKEIERLKRELSRQVRASSPPPMDLSAEIYSDGGLNGGAYARRSYVTSPTSPGKENEMSGALRSSKLSPAAHLGGAGATGLGIASAFGGGSPRGPRLMAPDAVDVARANAAGGMTAAGAASGAESWKRAAEVTQNLKARIEMMKVCALIPSVAAGAPFSDQQQKTRNVQLLTRLYRRSKVFQGRISMCNSFATSCLHECRPPERRMGRVLTSIL